jgi:hypothetical protein
MSYEQEERNRERLMWLLSRVQVDERGVSLPCGNTILRKESVITSLKQIDKNIDDSHLEELRICGLLELQENSND